MGLQEYFKKSGDGSRYRVSALLAVLAHFLVLAGGSLVMATQAEYGIAGAVASGGPPQKFSPPPEESVDFEDFSDDAPAERRAPPKPRPTPPLAPGTSGAFSGGAREVPSYYRNPPPPYPEEARRLKEEGLAVIRAEVDPEGKVSSAALAQSTGFPLLDEAALRTVEGWQFKPARVAGVAIPTSVAIPVRFKLKDEE